MTFPVSPTNGQVTTVNGITYVYSSTDNAWTRSAQPVGNLTVSGNVVTGKLYTNEGLYWAGNGNVIVTGGAGGGGTFTASNTAPVTASASDFWYYVAGDILFQYINDGDSSQWVDISSPYITQTATISDVVLSNVTVSSWANVTTVRTSLGITPTTIGTAPPVSPYLGDTWYNTAEDVMYQYINDGVGNWWVDISSDTLSTIGATNLLETTMQGNLIPSANATYTLGNTTYRFKDQYISANVISGNIITDNQYVSGKTVTGNILTTNGIFWAGNGAAVSSDPSGVAIAMSIVFGGS